MPFCFFTEVTVMTITDNISLADTSISSTLGYYLETIYSMSQKQPAVRITDISMCLGISKPSVNRAVNALKSRGLVSHEPYGDIFLTDKGRSLGGSMYGRHRQIRRFLMNVLKMNETDADAEAYNIAHNISQNTVDKMVSFMEMGG